jgi:hypothetical protein
MRIVFYLLIGITSLCEAQIRVSDNHRFLSTIDGKPFFWLGDTDWELFHRLTREEVVDFLNIRQRQGFNVLQAVALAEFNGIRQPNRYGDWPLNNEDPTQLAVTPGNDPQNEYEYDYWDHVDYVIEQAAQRNIYIGLLPTWGDKVTMMWGEGPVIFNEQNAEVYGKIIASRYSKSKNIIWILGGDRPAVYNSKDGKKQDDRAIWRAMAKGIESIAGKDAFITYHPSGGEYSTSQYIQDELWLDMNAFQSGHGARESPAWEWTERDLALQPKRPTLDMEPCYEDHPVNPWDGKWTRQRGYFTAYDVRARIYRGVFAGACGVTYGHHQIWQFLNKELNQPVNIGDTIIGWRKAAEAPGANQMLFLKKLMLSRPYFNRVQDNSMILSPKGTTYLDISIATRDQDKSYAMIYLPTNKTIKVNLKKISGSSKNIWWFDPRTGRSTFVKNVKGNSKAFTPPSNGQDWVLVIDDATQNFNAPGL